MATLASIKKQLNLGSLELVTATDENGNPTDWLRHWENDSRMAVSIHKELATELSQDKSGSIKSLGLQHKVKEGEQGPYDAYRIVKFNSDPEMVL